MIPTTGSLNPTASNPQGPLQAQSKVRNQKPKSIYQLSSLSLPTRLNPKIKKSTHKTFKQLPPAESSTSTLSKQSTVSRFSLFVPRFAIHPAVRSITLMKLLLNFSFFNTDWVLRIFFTELLINFDSRLSFPELRNWKEMNQKGLIYSFVSKGTVVLAEHTSYSGNFSTIAIQCLQKLPASSSKYTYSCDGHTFNFLLDSGFGIFFGF